MTSISPTPVVREDGPTVSEACIVAARAADAKSGEDTTILSMDELLGLTDAFVITSGRNVRQVRSIVDEVELRVKAFEGRPPVRVEGLDDARWVLMDYGDFLVHVFLDEARHFYDLEHLWLDGPGSNGRRPTGPDRPAPVRATGPGVDTRRGSPARAPGRRWPSAPRGAGCRS